MYDFTRSYQWQSMEKAYLEPNEYDESDEEIEEEFEDEEENEE